MRLTGVWPAIVTTVLISAGLISCGNEDPAVAEPALFAYSTTDSVVLNDGPTEIGRRQSQPGDQSILSFTSDSRFVTWVEDQGTGGLVNALAVDSGELRTQHCRCDRAVAVANGAIAWVERPTDTRQPERIMRWNPAGEVAPEVWRTLPIWSVPKADDEFMARQSFTISSAGDRILLSGTAYSRTDFSANNLLFEVTADGSIRQFGALETMEALIDGVYSPDRSSVLLYSNDGLDSGCANPKITTVELTTEIRGSVEPGFGHCASITRVSWPGTGPTAVVSGKGSSGNQQWHNTDGRWQQTAGTAVETIELGSAAIELTSGRELSLVRSGDRTVLGRAVDTVTVAPRANSVS